MMLSTTKRDNLKKGKELGNISEMETYVVFQAYEHLTFGMVEPEINQDILKLLDHD